MNAIYRQQEIVLSATESVCPECLQRIPARRVARGDSVFLRKSCPEHGEYQVCVWEGDPDYFSWNNVQTPAIPQADTTTGRRGCPFDCGLCPEHRQQTCCVLLEVTGKCNLHCPVCFASASPAGGTEPDLAVIEGWFRLLMDKGGPYNIQLSGGEPTVRDDLPAIITLGRKLGFEFFQINTNGLRLAAEDSYTARLKAAGLNCVFLQFDGMDDGVHTKLRGRPLLAEKKRVIEACADHDIGVVLVPTLVPGVNDMQIGDILQFAVSKMPVVRGVHFQPVSYFGRCPENPGDADRLTIPRIIREIERQTAGQMKARHFFPPGGEHAYCSFHGNFVLLADGNLQPLSQAKSNTGCCQARATQGSRQARQFVARQWSAAGNRQTGKPEQSPSAQLAGDLTSLDEFLERINTYKLAVSGMAFQDAWTLDLERLKHCFIHVVGADNRLIPFCAYNLTDRQGRSLYRGKP
ncbi:radical SAM (seleno)protein TrsS [Sporomusa termitida]|uniref:Coenzyme PQQ synthesis protein E n=1 Tax=Sporomusa termitida TaxID=2377 RepID=A0A517DQP7_9FIRM|nr:radical SAM (seleno)protein TrsS [Sporomusa termitida]QDR79684.1 Coenzyme PQQ synthesis protein E [Sporomusa termitida]